MPPVARADMLIRKPVAKDFNAFVKPSLLKKFWLKRASAPLSAGAKVDGEFRVLGPTRRSKSRVSLIATRLASTGRMAKPSSCGSSEWEIRHLRRVQVDGFKGAKAVPEAISTTDRSAIVLCDLKSFLESGKFSHVVRDKAKLIAAGKQLN